MWKFVQFAIGHVKQPWNSNITYSLLVTKSSAPSLPSPRATGMHHSYRRTVTKPSHRRIFALSSWAWRSATLIWRSYLTIRYRYMWTPLLPPYSTTAGIYLNILYWIKRKGYRSIGVQANLRVLSSSIPFYTGWLSGSFLQGSRNSTDTTRPVCV